LIEMTLGLIIRSDDHHTATSLGVLSNHSGVDVTNVDVDLVLKSLGPTTLSAASHPSRPPDWSCQSTGPLSVRCRLPLIRGVEGAFVPLVVTIDPADEGRFALTAQATWSVGDATFTSAPRTVSALYQREVPITNTNDDGEGSLRAAIDYANDTCARDLVPCALQFGFTEARPDQGWYTIRPLTPLPAITAPDITIDSRTSLVNSAPRVELDGSLLSSGNGLELRGEGQASLTYLAIGGFAGDGVSITRRGPTSIFACSIGLHPNGQPNGNGSRGVSIDTPASDVLLASTRISANRRSGVFIMGGERITLDPYNVIGRFNTDNPLLGNGASGVFVGPNAHDIVIQQTFIGGNAQMGVAIAPEARSVRIDNTWIDPNGGLPIDHGLNGFSGEVRDPSHFALPAPRIELATYDATRNTTTIHGTFDAPDPDTSWTLTVFGSSMGDWPNADLPALVFRGKTFTMTMGGHPDVLRATAGAAYFGDWSTSEYSLPVAVRSTGPVTRTRPSRF
ncbi:MAG TPA: right-handed parallel beta-helix repeat-containing protein, partial [Thermoanaerobaculia bacterium]|nr:right-handed parallel beta-helix repeat-containing protein [Thermoanaerobaculia bacterium]